MDLYQLQLQKQEDIISNRIKELENNPPKTNDEKVLFQISKTLSKYINEFKEEKLLSFSKKLVMEYEKEILEILGINKKNIDDYVGKPLTKFLLDNGKYDDFNQFLKNDNIDINQYKELVKFFKKHFKNAYIEIFQTATKANEQAGLYLYLLKNLEISYLVIQSLIQLLASDNYDEDNKVAIAQNVVDLIIENLVEYLQNKKNRMEKNDDTNEQIKNINYVLNLDDDTLKKIGSQIINILLEHDYISRETNETGVIISLSQNLKKELKKLSKSYIVKFGIRYEPMIVPPRDWIDVDDGGFLKSKNNSNHYNLIFIKTSSRQEKQEALTKKGKIPKEIFQAINNIQQTPFKINKKTLQVIKKVIKNIKKDKKGNFKKSYYEKLTNKTPSQKIEYKLAKLKTSLDFMIKVADEYQKFENIYFVWQIDFRGRIYPVQVLLHPQGGDVSKSMLLFSKSQKVNSKGIEWFKIHGANMYGEVDKENFDIRIKWIDENKDNILNSAKNPLQEDFWKNADEPFEFLAFCFEYEKYIQNPDNFVTSLPIAIDGSNNGLQHISTLLRDKESAKKVNVLPTGKVADIYKEVAKSTKIILEKELEKFNKNKDNYIKKNGLYFEIENKEIKDIRNILPEVIQEIKKFDVSTLKTGQYISNAIDFDIKGFKNKEIQEFCEKIERMKIKEIGNQPTKIQRRLVRELENNIDDFEEEKENGELIEKNGIFYKIEKKEKFVEESLIETIFKAKNIDRSFVKKSVMTDSYGSSQGGKKWGILDDLEDLKEFEKIKELEKGKYLSSFAFYLAGIIEKAIETESNSSQKYKKFMKKVAKKIVNLDKHIEWNTPLGFEVSQTEYKTKSEKIYINLKRKDGSTYQKPLTIKIYTNKINKDKHRSGIAPNYIHSLDATHLYMTINSLAKNGISDFLTVHDSFGTLPNDVELLSQTLRKEFINLYSQPILENFIKDIENRYNINLDIEIPYIDDDFDLDEINNSIYFFA